MKPTLLIITGILFLNSCIKEILTDEELTLNRNAYTGDQLRIDGYYYTQFRDIYRIYFFSVLSEKEKLKRFHHYVALFNFL